MAFARDAHHRPGQRRAEQDAVEAGREGDDRPEADRLPQQAALAVRMARGGPLRRFRRPGRSASVRHDSRSEESSAMSARYTLHGIWASGPTYKAGLLLALAGEPFDYVHVDLRAGERSRVAEGDRTPPPSQNRT